MWARALARNANLARERVFSAAAAHWMWRIVQQHCPLAIQIVDWFHASRDVVKIACATCGEGTPQALAWLKPVKTALYEGQLGSVIRACRADARAYFAYNRTRLRYAKFRSMGLLSASGSMESGCKHIALQRLIIAGAQWSVAGPRNLAKARAAFRSLEVNLAFSRLPQLA